MAIVQSLNKSECMDFLPGQKRDVVVIGRGQLLEVRLQFTTRVEKFVIC